MVNWAQCPRYMVMGLGCGIQSWLFKVMVRIKIREICGDIQESTLLQVTYTIRCKVD